MSQIQITNSKLFDLFSCDTLKEYNVQYDLSTSVSSTYCSAWTRLLNIEKNYLYLLEKKLPFPEYLHTQQKIINNIINEGLLDIKNVIIKINNVELTLSAWEKHCKVKDLYFCHYCYVYGIEMTKKFIMNFLPESSSNTSVKTSMQKVFTQKVSMPTIPRSKAPAQKVPTQEVSLNNNYVINLIPMGKLITINDITNNISGWNKLTGIYIPCIDVNQYIEKIKQFLSIKLDNDYFEINNLYANYQQWSLFINKDKNYLERMIAKMGYNYTKQYLYNLIVNNESFITYSKNIIINNESHTILGWAKKINKSANYMYKLNKRYGMDYVINYINRSISKSNNKLNNKSNKETIIFMDEF